MDLGWSTVHAEPPVKGGLVCVLPHLVFAWMKLPLKVAYVDKGSYSMGGKSGWSGGKSSCSIVPILHLLHSAAIRLCHFLNVSSQNAISPGSCIRHSPTCVGQQLKYAHSTLHGHALAGEERFAVEWHKEDDSVW